MKFEEAFRYKLIYIFSIPDDLHRGYLKIGDTTLKTNRRADFFQPNCNALKAAAKARINEYTQTAAVPFKLEHTELAVAGDIPFRDYHVHCLLKKYRRKIKDCKGREWFKVDLNTAIKAIAEVKQKLSASIKIPGEIVLRSEQEEAITRTVKYFKNGNEFLWNAKMRFGKTLCALEVVKRMNFAKTIIITHRPVVNEGWYEDFQKIFGGNKKFDFGSKFKGKSFNNLKASKKNFVYFASIQDLRGSQIVNEKSGNAKNFEIFNEEWDFVIIDEAHEGTTTDLGKKLRETLVKGNTKLLELSGTPFNIIERYGDNVFTWDYVMEQKAKADWDKNNFGDSNPYEELPQMNIYTYDLGKVFDYVDAEDKSFSFSEFFRTSRGRFVHERDVEKFLDMLGRGSNNNYPFSRTDFREMLKHTLWIIPGVKEGKALSELLKNHPAYCVFEIVNVAGDGDGDNNYSNALEKVRDAIDNNEYTITLSCGKLTTGVTVPEWTAVLYLAGGYLTSAASYLQTIFRVQSPCKIDGKFKNNCFVFDFAPDRALRMITAAAAISPKAGKNQSSDCAALNELLNFCPVIAVTGSKMRYSADNLMIQLKEAWIKRAVRNGFDDNCLYNDKLFRLEEVDMKKFDDINARIKSSNSQKNSDIIINAQGIDEGTRVKTVAQKRERTPEQELHDEQLKRRRKAISILRQVSIRMPLLIYGANVPLDKEITIERFAAIVDDASWEEFMPKGFTKKDFANIIEYYDPNIFIGTGNEVRKLAKEADDLKPTERIKKIAALFATFKNPDKETVLTPWRVVNLHLSATFGGYDFFDYTHQDMLETPRYVPTEIFKPDKKILEINAKTGLYPLYVAYSIYRARFGEVDENSVPPDESRRLWDKTVAENIFVICKTPMAETITRRTLLGYRQGTVNAKFFDNLIDTLKERPMIFLWRVTNKNFWDKGVGKMFFDAVVGNPPYQSKGNGDNKNFAPPVYDRFIKSTYNEKLTKHASLIHPARFLFSAGATPGNFGENFLKNQHVKIVRYEIDGKKFFPTSDIKGGIAITEFDATKTFEPIGIFIPFEELISIHQKVCVDYPNFKPLSDIMYSRTAYSLTPKAHEDFPDAAKNFSKGNQYQMSSNVFDLMPEIFFDAKPNDGHEYIQLYGRKNNERVFKWVRRDYVTPHESLEKFKVFVPDSNGSGALGEVVSTPLVGTPLVGTPLVGCTQTFITVGAFETRAEAEACIAYIKTRFCRAMLGILKVTQHNPPQTWAKVPKQNFNPKTSDIIWRTSIDDIDEQLFDKYGLTGAEREFIKAHVKKMD